MSVKRDQDDGQSKYQRIHPQYGDDDSGDLTLSSRLAAFAAYTTVTHAAISSKLERLALAIELYDVMNYGGCMLILGKKGQKVDKDAHNTIFAAFRTSEFSLGRDLAKYKTRISPAENFELKRSYYDPATFESVMKGQIEDLSNRLEHIGRKIDDLGQLLSASPSSII